MPINIIVMRKISNRLTYQILSVSFLSILAFSCSKDDAKVKVTDIDGNTYNTVTVGTEVWLVEGLKTTKYTDGTAVPIVTENTAWTNLTTGGMCDYNNTLSNSTTYGKLYNWYAVSGTKKLCPAGWHVPTDSDWSDLVTALGGYDAAAAKMMEAGIVHWLSPNSFATNTSGFTALGTGYRNYLGEFKDLKYMGGFWSANSIDATYASYRSMYAGSISIDNHGVNKKTGLSVRCVKD